MKLSKLILLFSMTRLINLFFIDFALSNDTRKAVELFYQIDKNQNLELTVDEVAKWIERTVALDRKIKSGQILKAYDNNRNGRVDKHELLYHTAGLDEETAQKYLGKFEMVDVDEDQGSTCCP